MKNRILNKRYLMLSLLFLLGSLGVTAQPKVPGALDNPLAQVLLGIMILLALAIAILANVVNQAAAMYRDKLKEERDLKSSVDSSAPVMIAFLLGAGLLTSISGFAQNPSGNIIKTSLNFNGLSALTFFIMVAAIAIEIIILIALIYQLKFLVGIESKPKKVFVRESVEKEAPKKNWWWRINNANDLANEEDVDLSHDYDGISELDNKLPPWWTVAFGLTILFSVVYLYRYHVAESAPLQIEEFQIAMKEAEIEKNAYLAETASNVDENTVTMLDEGAIASGKALFSGNCTPCHGAIGEGNAVGPNLTDEYWINGGNLSDIFKSIKYGWPDKGMRSWKDDFAPVQIAQLTSFIHSIKGTNPPNAKEPQGEKFVEQEESPATTDSTKSATVKL
jgi:cytochrome c oxidase cbb3-type subunit 3